MASMTIPVGRGSQRPISWSMHAAILSCLSLLLVFPARAEPAEFCVTCQGPDATYRCSFASDATAPARPGLQLYCISTLAREGGHQSCSIGRATKSACPGTLKVLALPGDGPSPAPGDPAHAAIPAPADPAEAMPANPPQAAAGMEPPQTDVEMQGVRQPTAAPDQPPSATSVKRTWDDNSGPAGETAKTAQAPADKQPPSAEAADEATTQDPAAPGPLEGTGKAVSDAAKTTGDALGKAGDAVGSAAKKSWKCLTSLFGDC